MRDGPYRLSAKAWAVPWLVAFAVGLWTGYLSFAPPRLATDETVAVATPPRTLKRGPIASRVEVSPAVPACNVNTPPWDELLEQVTWYEPTEICSDVHVNGARHTRFGPTICLPHDKDTPYLGPGVSAYEPFEETACR